MSAMGGHDDEVNPFGLGQIQDGMCGITADDLAGGFDSGKVFDHEIGHLFPRC